MQKGIWSGGINIMTQSIMNKRQQQFAVDMYNRQRSDALADWKTYTDYNSPSSQMERLKAAGLNPNLVYGNGADATANSPIRNTDAPTWKPEAPRVDSRYSSGLSDFQDVRIKEAQVQNLEAQNQDIRNSAALKAVQVANGLKEGAKRDTDLAWQEDFKQGMYAYLQQSIDTGKYKQAMLLQQFDQLVKTKETNIATAKAILVGILAKNAKTKLEGDYINELANSVDVKRQLDQLELKMRKVGGTFSDPFWQRQLVGIFAPE